MEQRLNLAHIQHRLRQVYATLADTYHLQAMGIFGSYVRQEQSFASDVDILVRFAQPPSLFTFLRLERELTELLGIRGDLVMESALKPTIGKRILNEVVAV